MKFYHYVYITRPNILLHFYPLALGVAADEVDWLNCIHVSNSFTSDVRRLASTGRRRPGLKLWLRLAGSRCEGKNEGVQREQDKPLGGVRRVWDKASTNDKTLTIDEPGTDSKENIPVLLVQLLISERVDSEWSAKKMERH